MQSASHAAASAGPVVRAAQVTSLALCKHNKNDLLLVKLRRHVRHGRARSMFWRYNEVPKEALAVLEVRLNGRMCICACSAETCNWGVSNMRVCSATRCLVALSARQRVVWPTHRHFHCNCLCIRGVTHALPIHYTPD